MPFLTGRTPKEFEFDPHLNPLVQWKLHTRLTRGTFFKGGGGASWLRRPLLFREARKAPMNDLRSNPRHACAFPAVFEGPRGAVRGTCTNLSVGGLFFEGAQLAIGSNVSVTLDLGALGKLKLSCQVRHHVLSPKGMGAQFSRFDPGQGHC